MVRSAASNISDFDLVKERKVAEEEDKKVTKSIGVPSSCPLTLPCIG